MTGLLLPPSILPPEGMDKAAPALMVVIIFPLIVAPSHTKFPPSAISMLPPPDNVPPVKLKLPLQFNSAPTVSLKVKVPDEIINEPPVLIII